MCQKYYKRTKNKFCPPDCSQNYYFFNISSASERERMRAPASVLITSMTAHRTPQDRSKTGQDAPKTPPRRPTTAASEIQPGHFPFKNTIFPTFREVMCPKNTINRPKKKVDPAESSQNYYFFNISSTRERPEKLASGSKGHHSKRHLHFHIVFT